MQAAITAVLTLIEQLIPLLGLASTNATVKLIASIITTLVQFMPQIENEVSVVYQSVKNIIGALSANPDATSTQLQSLQKLDEQVDAAWNKVAPDFDPDAAA